MRRRIQNEYLNYAEAFAKDYDNDTIIETPLSFRYKNFEGKKSKFAQEQLIEGYISTDEGRTIETVTSIAINVGWKVEINGVRYEVIEVGIQTDETLKYGAIRKRKNRDKKVIVLS